MRSPCDDEVRYYQLVAVRREGQPPRYYLSLHNGEHVGEPPDTDDATWVVLDGIIAGDQIVSYRVAWYYDPAVAYEAAEEIALDASRDKDRCPVNVILTHVQQQCINVPSVGGLPLRVYVLEVVAAARISENGDIT